MSLQENNIEVVAFTRPDIFEFGRIGKPFPYQRVVALWRNDGFFGEHVGEKNLRNHDEKPLTVPKEIGFRLLEAMRVVAKPNFANCHYFGRLISGAFEAAAPPQAEHFEAPFYIDEGQKIDTPLAEGEVGVIGSPERYPDHALVGTGANIAESIQVMSGQSEFGIALNADVLRFYRELNPKDSVDIYRQVK